jgi:CRP-like cAMP-binding protein
MENMAVLKQIALFEGLDSLELIQVSKLVKNRHFAKDDLVIREGDVGTSLFAVKSGEFRAFIGQGLNAAELAQFKHGDSFGELALIDHAPRSASVEALTDGELLEFDKKAFETLLAYSEDMRSKLYRNLVTDLAAKLRRTNDSLAMLL